MTPVETGLAYDQITQRWTRPEFNRNNGIAQHKVALSFLDVFPSEHDSPRATSNLPPLALDVGCGCTGRFIDLLHDNEFVVEGIDISSEMLTLVRERHPNNTFYFGDICTFNLPHQYRFISAWDCLWHVPLHSQAALITKLCHALQPGGVLIFSCGGVDEPGEHTNTIMGPEVYYASLGINGYVRHIIEADCFIRHIEYGQLPEFHTYFVVQKAIPQK
jgi:SAM-dependent methyltransferase